MARPGADLMAKALHASEASLGLPAPRAIERPTAVSVNLVDGREKLHLGA
jgi:hypothetical protein